MTKFPKLSQKLILEAKKGYHQFMSEDLIKLDHEKKLYDVVGIQIKTKEHITLNNLFEILKWRQPALPGHFKLNNEKRVKEISKYAYKTQDEEIRVAVLTLIKGVGLPSATRILSITNPELYPTYHKMGWLVLKKWNFLEEEYRLNTNKWIQYLNSCRRIMEKYSISGRELDQILIATYLKHNLNINLQKFVPLDEFL